jgi:pilus assembly protein Flp/PilA
MKKIRMACAALWDRDAGITTVEYAIAGGLVGLALVVAFPALGAKVGAVIANITGLLPA